MNAMYYAAAVLALWTACMAGALAIWRALHGLYNRLRDDRDATRAAKRYKEQSKAIRESFDKR